MKNSMKHFIVAIQISIVFLLSFEVVFATPTNEMGCILKQPGSMKFVEGDTLDKEAIGEAAANAHHMQGTRVIDPCMTGQARDIPASVYAKLAEKYPEKFQPFELEISDQRIASQATTNTAPHVTPKYHYVGIFETIPPGFSIFDPIALTNHNRIHGTAFTEPFDEPPFFTVYAAVFEQGAMTILQGSEGVFVTTVNESGTIGGFVITDFENFSGQAVLFHENEIQLIPRLPGEVDSRVLHINDSGVALVFSHDENFNGNLALYKNGKVIPLDVGPDIPFASFLSMNNHEVISGTTFIAGLGFRGFRFDPRTNTVTLLEPLPTEPHSWALDINNHGDVLGYSFVSGALERIGVWDKKGEFHTYFVEGTPEFPTISNRLHFNDKNFIAITRVSSPLNERNNSYLVPKPNVRLNLADLVADTPSGLSLFPSGINNHGNLFGNAGPDFFNVFDSFLLELKHKGRSAENP